MDTKITIFKLQSAEHQSPGKRQKTGPVSLHRKKQWAAFGIASETLNLTKEFKLSVAPSDGKPHARITTPPVNDTMKQTENC